MRRWPRAAAKVQLKPTDDKIRVIARRLYETHQYDTTRVNQKTKATETFVEYDDETAFLRFDNIISGKHPMIAREAHFFRLCLQHLFGTELVATVTDDEIVSGSAQLLIRRLLSEMPTFDWHRFDPLDALLAMAHATEYVIPISLTQIGTNHRWIVQDEDASVPDFPVRESLLLRKGAKFKLTIAKNPGRWSAP